MSMDNKHVDTPSQGVTNETLLNVVTSQGRFSIFNSPPDFNESSDIDTFLDRFDSWLIRSAITANESKVSHLSCSLPNKYRTSAEAKLREIKEHGYYPTNSKTDKRSNRRADKVMVTTGKLYEVFRRAVSDLFRDTSYADASSCRRSLRQQSVAFQKGSNFGDFTATFGTLVNRWTKALIREGRDPPSHRTIIDHLLPLLPIELTRSTARELIASKDLDEAYAIVREEIDTDIRRHHHVLEGSVPPPGTPLATTNAIQQLNSLKQEMARMRELIREREAKEKIMIKSLQLQPATQISKSSLIHFPQHGRRYTSAPPFSQSAPSMSHSSPSGDIPHPKVTILPLYPMNALPARLGFDPPPLSGPHRVWCVWCSTDSHSCRNCPNHCPRCGDQHRLEQCPLSYGQATCSRCNQTGHLAASCLWSVIGDFKGCSRIGGVSQRPTNPTGSRHSSSNSLRVAEAHAPAPFVSPVPQTEKHDPLQKHILAMLHANAKESSNISKRLSTTEDRVHRTDKRQRNYADDIRREIRDQQRRTATKINTISNKNRNRSNFNNNRNQNRFHSQNDRNPSHRNDRNYNGPNDRNYRPKRHRKGRN